LPHNKMDNNILDTFGAHQGVISVVGAGGKKSTIFRLASAHTGKIAITSTVYTPRFRRRLNVHEIIAEADELNERIYVAAKVEKRVAYAHPSDKPARLRGVLPETVRMIHNNNGFDATFVKADGARLRWLKAPDKNEPVPAGGTTLLIPVLSIRAIGIPLSGEVAHRPRDTARIMQMELGERISAVHLARLISSDQGSVKNAGDATIIPVLNMVESKQDLRLARLVAEQALDRSTRFNRVVLASMVRENPVLQVIQR